MKGEAIPRVELELACTSSQEPMIDLPGTVQTSRDPTGGTKVTRLGIFTPWKLANAKSQAMLQCIGKCYNATMLPHTCLRKLTIQCFPAHHWKVLNT